MNFKSIAASIVAVLTSVAPVQAEPGINYPGGAEYGYGENYFDICNETYESVVTFYTDETQHMHMLEIGECDRIYTNYNYIIVSYDSSWEYGDQLNSLTIEYPNDINLVNDGYDGYGERIGHIIW